MIIRGEIKMGEDQVPLGASAEPLRVVRYGFRGNKSRRNLMRHFIATLMQPGVFDNLMSLSLQVETPEELHSLSPNRAGGLSEPIPAKPLKRRPGAPKESKPGHPTQKK